MAEHIAGSEDEFVRKMNERAESLGMNHTNFVNCNGLDTEGHVTSAGDIAVMSAELITKYPEIHDYSMIWMENITHQTSNGATEFGLTNTNKLVRQYEYATGLKTGSTSDAGFCISATAEKNGVELIAVIMAAETSKDRFSDAVKLLNYGFGKCRIYTDNSDTFTHIVKVADGIPEQVEIERKEPFTYLDMTGADLSKIEMVPEINSELEAPLVKGDSAGYLKYFLDGTEIGKTEIIVCKNVKKAIYSDYLKKIYDLYCV